MSRRRKNAGQGFGMTFHGSFSKKADAVAKEKKRKGAFVRGVLTNQGYRYLVMSPRTNPIPRKKRAKKQTKAEVLKQRLAAERQHLQDRSLAERARGNPSELLVMGANPTDKHQEIKIPIPGGEVTIRTNPEPRTNSLGSLLGFSPSKPTKKELRESRRSFRAGVRSRVKEDREDLQRLRRSARASQKQSRTSRVFHEVYGKQLYDAEGLPTNPHGEICGAMIGGYQCTRKPGHRGPHLPQGATMRTRHRLPKPWQPNPSAAALREKFTGSEVKRVNVYDEPHMPAGDYADLGKLLTLYVKPHRGGQVLTITPQNVRVVSDESGRQIYFVGGDQDVSEGLHLFGAVDRGAGVYELGQARRIDYKQRKEHVPHPEVDSWRHEFGEENGVHPTVLFYSRFGRLALEGGNYEIRPEGIVN